MAASDPQAERPLRADAERNRKRILEAASQVFAERGLDVSLDEIAAAAGVGVGTVYRRFGDKDALIDALFAERIDAVVQLGRRCLEEPDPWTAFADFIRGVCRLNAEDRGLKETLLSGDRGSDRVRHGRDSIAPIGFAILRRAQEAGVVRADMAGTDIPLLHFAVGFVAEKTQHVRPDLWERVATILLDGLAVSRDAPTPMTAEPITPAEMPEVMSRRRPTAS